MAENVDSGAPHHEESLLDKIAGKLHLRKEDDIKEDQHHHLDHDDHDHDHDDGKKDDSSSSSSSSSDDDVSEKKHEVTSATDAPASSVKDKINRLFGRQKPVHQVLGGGKPADVFLWKNKKVSASVLATATAVWVFFELLEYHLLTLLCHILIFSLAILFLWAHGTTLVNKSPPKIPDVSLPERPFLEFASGLTYEINRGLALVHSIAMGRDMKKFLIVIAGLWVLSVLGKCCDFLTLFYINFVLLHTVPVLYEKYEDKVDAFAEKAMAEGKKYYNVVNEKYISKIPRGPLKNKKFN